ncbi:MAG TPA: hypothetical protein VM223_13560 [Planctomycetota bacterium]|nr:hypothetical protein [Planctomycetota bacterium]HUW32632.1 hypothetical protein [Planctomycetota bacterium]
MSHFSSRQSFRVIMVLAFIAGAILIFRLVLGRAISDEQRIRNTINVLADSAEDRNLRKITGLMHDDFRAEEFTYDRQTCIDLMRQVFFTYKVIRVRLRDVSVKIIDDSTAEAIFIATVSASQSPDSAGEDLTRQRGSDRFRLTFKKVNGTWLVYRSAVVRSTAD